MDRFTDRQIEIMEAATAIIDKSGIQNMTIKNLATDIGLSEPALYRHFNSKNDILLGLLEYFKAEMKGRLSSVGSAEGSAPGDVLRQIFKLQLQAFSAKPAIVSVIFAEGIFHFDEALSGKVSEIMSLMHDYVRDNIKKGQEAGNYTTFINHCVLTTIITGGMRMAVLKWRLSGHKANLVKDGMAVLEGILKMIEK
ncbi:MAG TPA: TetR/AcrR family transcriptional regulator [Ginsengibacter sp.]|nr:TetR/AcrR family transcriptional regulator [Agriterribacter sp.]HRP43248.1 TetR/AcrR family transcriptional regulator [Ginsengibacter sp.]